MLRRNYVLFSVCANTDLVSECLPGSVQLFNTTTGYTAEGAFYIGGEVAICHNESYGTICGQGWDERDATVVCRQLNYIPPIYGKLAASITVHL